MFYKQTEEGVNPLSISDMLVEFTGCNWFIYLTVKT